MGRNKQQGEYWNMEILEEICTQLQQGRAKNVRTLVQDAVSQGIDPRDILNEGLLKGMDIIGAKFKANEVFVPEVLVAARAMNMGINELKPYLADSQNKVHGRVAIGTVEGDLHDIGKNLVKLMIEGKGLEVVDLGADVPPEKFVQAVQEQDCNIVACSALLTTTMGAMADVVKALEAAGLRDKVKIMIGGAPVSEEFCRQIGADIYTDNATSAAEAAVAAAQEMA
jgi:corrinoid protein of di/trimethylamine methyltransferase